VALRFEFRPARRIENELLPQIGERLELAVPHHSVAFWRGRTWLAVAGVWVLLVLATNARVEALLPAFPIAARGWWLLVKTHLDWFVVTNMRILRIQGVLNVKHAAMSLSRIVDFTMQVPFWGQMLGYGHLVFENAAQDQGLREIHHIGKVDKVYQRIQELAFEQGGGPGKNARPAVPAEPAEPFEPPVAHDMDATGEIPAVR
jgi:hypothetical protein